MSESSENFDPASNTWTAAASLSQARYSFYLAVTPTGQVLAVGGSRYWDSCLSKSSFVREIESYDPSSNQWQIDGMMPEFSPNTTASLLQVGRFWIAGGWADNDHEPYLADTWLISSLYAIFP